MPFYRYKARNRDKYVVSNIIEATDKGEAVRKIKKDDLVPVDVNEIKVGVLFKGKDILITSGVSKQDIVFFLSQFYNLLNAGLGVIECFKIIIDQTSNKYLKKYLIEILQDLRNGSSLYKAIKRQKKAFPKLMIEMIRVGEVIGNLKTVVYDLYIYYKKQNKTASEIKSAMIYPMFVFVATVGVSIFLLTTVIPQFEKIFEDSDKELPFITKFVMSISNFLVYQSSYLVLSILLLATLIFLYFKTDEGKMFFSKLFLKIPLLGAINRKGNLIRIARTYSTLLNNSVNAIESLEITRNILKNQVYIELIDKALVNVQNGVPISNAFSHHWAVDPVFSNMMAIGEETASLGEMLSSIAEYYDNEMDSTVEKFKKMLEPIMILILVVIVGVIVLSILIPMFSLMDINS